MPVSSRRMVRVAALVLGAGLVTAPTATWANPTAVTATPATAVAAGHPGKVVSAYYADWDVYARGYYVKDIPADKLTVIQYAFGVPTFDKATGAVGCDVLDPWADYQMPYWSGDNTVNGVADDPSNPDQHLFGAFNQLRQLKAAHPGLKVEISLGGWTKSTWFSSVAATPDRRQAFVRSCLDTFIRGNLPGGGWPAQAGGTGAAAGVFDGIDLDWEYPNAVGDGNVDFGPADVYHATQLANEFRRQLDALGRANHTRYLLTAATPAAARSSQYYDLGAFAGQLDWVNLMTYDFNIPSGPLAAPDTLFTGDPRDPNAADPTWNTVGTVNWYLHHGVPANKIVVGVPFYANQYLRTAGLYAPHDSSGLDPNTLQWDSTNHPTYHDLIDVAKVLTPDGTAQGGFTRHWDGYAGEPWLYGPAISHDLCAVPRGGDFSCAQPYTESTSTVITYDDPRAMAERTDLVRTAGLRGVMAWEISQDSNDHALLNQLDAVLAP